MNPITHLAASSIVSAGFAYATRSMPGTIVCFLSGVLIDVDHVLDYWIARRKLFMNYHQLFSFGAHEKTGKLFLIFHSYEWLAALWISIMLFSLGPVWWGLAIGITVHMLMDRIGNPLRPCVFFFIYRLKHGFSKKWIYPDEYYKTLK